LFDDQGDRENKNIPGSAHHEEWQAALLIILGTQDNKN
jgi:hypothetical protein